MLPYPVPKVNEEIFKETVECLVLLGVLEVANDSEWGAPSFEQCKTKSNLVRLLSDFRTLNKQLNKNIPFAKDQLNVIEIRGFLVC